MHEKGFEKELSKHETIHSRFYKNILFTSYSFFSQHSIFKRSKNSFYEMFDQLGHVLDVSDISK